MNRLAGLLLFTLTAACTGITPRVPASSLAAPATPAGSPAPVSPSGAPGAPLVWADLGPGVFTRAKAEGRFVVIDGSAEWCHWCHVMEATTYHDPAVRKLLDARFVAVKVDIDAQPDFEERYREYGWPATVLMTADGRELGKFKGYLEPEQFADILRTVARGGQSASDQPPAAQAEARALDVAGVDEARARVRRQLDDAWDPKEGGWGVPQKAPLGWDDAWTLSLARAGDAAQRDRALFTLGKESGIIDPVWGGVCQYSTDGDWMHPHHEKLLTVQAGAILGYAGAYALTRDERWLRTAQQVRGFVDGFLTGADGGFETTMDADLNAHEPGKPYMTGHDYYARGDAERRALGIPRVDTQEYARDNGVTIVAQLPASGDAAPLASARHAATRMLGSHMTDRGGITHGARPDDEGKVLYLADAASLGFALVHLYQVTREADLLVAAGRIAAFVLGELQDARGGGFYASTPDPGAVGVFAVRRKPVEGNVMAVRFLARLARVTPESVPREAVARALAVVTRAEVVQDRGRMVGDVLLALEEARGLL